MTELPWPLTLTHALLLVAVGLACEVVFTALCDFRKTRDLRLMGYTYVWMVPIYLVVYPALCILYPRVSAWAWPLRGAFYVALIYAVEYSSGWVLRKATGECPWERGYRGSRWSVSDLIRLDFAPGWLLAAFVYEWVFRVLRGLA